MLVKGTSQDSESSFVKPFVPGFYFMFQEVHYVYGKCYEIEDRQKGLGKENGDTFHIIRCRYNFTYTKKGGGRYVRRYDKKQRHELFK